MSVFWKIVGLSLFLPLLFSVIKLWEPSFETSLRVGAAIVMGSLVLSLWRPLGGLLSTLSGFGGDEGILGERLLPCLGVSLLSGAVSNVCRDSGSASLSGYVEYAGRLEMLWLCLPLLREIGELAAGLVRG